VVINAAAYTAWTVCESEEDLATLINATAPGAMAQGLRCSQYSLSPYLDRLRLCMARYRPWQPDAQPGP